MNEKLTTWLSNWKRNLLEVFVVAGILASAFTNSPGFTDSFVKSRFMSWPDDPWTMGGYSFPAPGQVTTVGPMIAKGLGRLHFAGEHVKTFGGEPPGFAHALEGCCAVNLDLAGLALRRECRVDVAHFRIAAVPPPAAGRRVPTAM